MQLQANPRREAARIVHPDLVMRFAAPVPRYTSYPTAPQFTPAVGHEQYAAWLGELPVEARLSLYVHIPFCHQLCWYCGCNTKATRRHAPVANYLKSLTAEIANIAARVPSGHLVEHMHWGGGSPNILRADDIERLADAIRSHLRVDRAVEFAVEIDPRHLEADSVDAFARAGVTRVSLGVQDFDRSVQAAIGREQGFEMTKRAVDAFRARGVASINIDLMYGLPHQTRNSLEGTIAQVLDLEPDRIAIFGYAHLPERMKNQRLIPQGALPNALERLDQSTRLAGRLEERGYVRIGLDHFAKPTDALARGPVSRNFQGYTTDHPDALLGVGASAIGRLPQGYVQNAVAVGDYAQRIRDQGLATAKGKAFSDDDQMRGYVIERLMCDLTFSTSDVSARFGALAEPVLREADELLGGYWDGLVEKTADGFIITELGRPFVRSICAHFDAYFGTGGARHSTGV